MLVLIPLLLLLGLLLATRKRSPAKTILIVYTISLCGALLLPGKSPPIDVINFLNMLFTIIVIICLTGAWVQVDYRTPITTTPNTRIRRITHLLLAVNSGIFVIFVTCAYFGFSTIENYSAVKNEGGASDLMESIPIPSFVILAAIYLHSTAFLLIPLHFYHQKIGNIKTSALCLLLSTNIILHGAIIFSRSGFVNFIFVYAFYLSFFYAGLNKTQKKSIKITFVILFSASAIAFWEITSNRFTSVLLYTIYSDQNRLTHYPLIYSMVDYGSQWYENGIAVLAMYNFEPFWGGLSFPLIGLLLDKVGLDGAHPRFVSGVLSEAWGGYYYKFNGITSNLLHDFGYIGTIVFLILYIILILRIGKPYKRTYSFDRILVMGAPFLLVCTGIFNYEMKSIHFNLYVIYSLAVYTYIKKARQPINRH